MARPTKMGVDYFPLDCVMDDKFQLLEAEYGLKGFAVVVKLFQRIYQSEGYYCEFNDDVALLFSKRIGEGRSVVSEIVSAALSRGIFDPDLYQKYQILTSMGIQKRYLEIVQRRKNIEMVSEYLLLPNDAIPVNVNILSVNVCNNPSKCIQKYTKESKGKESKEKHTENPLSSGKNNSCYEEIISYLNSKANTNFKSTTQATRRKIDARLNEGFSVDDFKKVIDNKCNEWLGDSKMARYLRPETLFGTKFEAYLQEKISFSKKSKKPNRSSFIKREEDSKGRDEWLKQQLDRSRKQSLRGDGKK